MSTISFIVERLKETNKTFISLINDLGLPRGNVGLWRTGKNRDYMKMIDRIAEFLEVDAHKLMEAADEKEREAAAPARDVQKSSAAKRPFSTWQPAVTTSSKPFWATKDDEEKADTPSVSKKAKPEEQKPPEPEAVAPTEDEKAMELVRLAEIEKIFVRLSHEAQDALITLAESMVEK